MEHKRYSIYFAFSQTQLVEGKTAPAVLLPNQENTHCLFGSYKM